MLAWGCAGTVFGAIAPPPSSFQTRNEPLAHIGPDHSGCRRNMFCLQPAVVGAPELVERSESIMLCSLS